LQNGSAIAPLGLRRAGAAGLRAGELSAMCMSNDLEPGPVHLSGWSEGLRLGKGAWATRREAMRLLSAAGRGGFASG